SAQADGKLIKFAVDENGNVINFYLQQDIAVSDLPAAVVAAIQAAFPGGTILKAQEVTNGQRTSYLVQVQSGGKFFGVAVDESGTILKQWQQKPPSGTGPQPIAVTALPQAVVDAVNAAVPSGTIIKAMVGTKNGTNIYQVETVTANKDVLLLVDGS